MAALPADAFNAIPLLATLKAADRTAVEPLCRVRDYEKGEVVFREGDAPEHIHFVYTGRVKIVKAAGSRDVILEILGPGEPAGAVAAFERRPFPATAVAVEHSTIISVPEHDFFALLGERPAMTRAMLSGMTMRLMMLQKRIADMTGAAESRAARMFITFAERMGVHSEEGIRIPIPLSRQELADLLGTTLETAIRLMSRWQKEGLVITEKTGFVIANLEPLREIARNG